MCVLLMNAETFVLLENIFDNTCILYRYLYLPCLIINLMRDCMYIDDSNLNLKTFSFCNFIMQLGEEHHAFSCSKNLNYAVMTHLIHTCC